MGEVNKDDPELSKALVCNTETKEERWLIDRLKFSDLTRAVKAVARLQQTAKKYKGLKQHTNESTSMEERKEAELAIIKLAEEEAFPTEIKRLKQKQEVAKTKESKIHKFFPG